MRNFAKKNPAKTYSCNNIIAQKKLVEFSALRAQHQKFYYIIINNFSSVFFSQNFRFPPPSPQMSHLFLSRNFRLFSRNFRISYFAKFSRNRLMRKFSHFSWANEMRKCEILLKRFTLFAGNFTKKLDTLILLTECLRIENLQGGEVG